MIETDGFFRDLPPQNDFRKIIEGAGFVSAPDDWTVIITDVKGSTQAIQDGRYRDVNLVGASGLTAVTNALPQYQIPGVFGGDGVTLLVPTKEIEKVRIALEGTQKRSNDMFGLELRAGAVHLPVLRAMGGDVQVAKYELSKGNDLAQFRGGGIALAETLIKKEPEKALIFQPDLKTPDPDLTGLSCRWQPFKNQRGVMLSLLVMNRAGENSETTYAEVASEIERMMGRDLRAANPVTARHMDGKFSVNSVLREVMLHGNGQITFKKFLKMAAIQFFALMIVKMNLNPGRFNSQRYRQETETNADYKKFDDMLRMVIDCGIDQADAIEKRLTELEKEGRLYYGAHRSDSAVMTCFVQDQSANRHVHFVDGSDGGYAMAAKILKSKFKIS